MTAGETNSGPRAQTTFSAGRLDVLKESDPQLRAATVGYVAAGETPLLGVPSMADSSTEAIDGRTLRFLLKKSLALQKKQEDEERRKVEEVEKELKAQVVEEEDPTGWILALYFWHSHASNGLGTSGLRLGEDEEEETSS